MKEKITEVLNDETLETVEDKVNAISKRLATLVVPKNKFNEMSDRVKSLTSEKEDLESELEDLKEQSLTADELKAKQEADFEKRSKELDVKLNTAKAREIFENAEIDKTKVEELLKKVVSADEKSTIELANSFVDILKTTITDTQKQTETSLLENTPKPNVKTQPNEPKKFTKEDFIKMTYLEKKDLLSSDKEQYNELLSEISK